MARATTFLDLRSRPAHARAARALLTALTAAAGIGLPAKATAAGIGLPAKATTAGIGLPAKATTAGIGLPAAVAATLWSAPSVLGPCPASEAPLVVFPSDSPAHATGPGAIVWDATSGCAGGEGAQVARLGSGDVPGVSTMPHAADGRALRLRGLLAASGGPYGRIVIAGSPAPSQDELTEGSALGPFVASTAGSGESALGPFSAPAAGSTEPAPAALATAYLGDVALASPFYTRGGEGVRLRVQRHRAQTFARSIAVSAGSRGRVTALTVALDYRSDALVVWRQGESIYARDLPASGRTRAAIQRLGPAAGPTSRIAALLSDDNRGIVAWSVQSGGETSVYIDLSATGVRFGAPRLLERFTGPAPLAPPEGSSPRLVRLSSESVMLSWTGFDGSGWSVRSAAIDLNGLGPVSTISPPGRIAVLAALAPGPDGEALALWTEP